MSQNGLIPNPRLLAEITGHLREKIYSSLGSDDANFLTPLLTQVKSWNDQVKVENTPENQADLLAQLLSCVSFLNASMKHPELSISCWEIPEVQPTLLILTQVLDDPKNLLFDELDHLATIFTLHMTQQPVIDSKTFVLMLLELYETFLTYYNPTARKKQGVYYTPNQVVEFVIRSCQSLLKKNFDLPYGLATSGLQIVDPAVGTGSFLNEVSKVLSEITHNELGKPISMVGYEVMPLALLTSKIVLTTAHSGSAAEETLKLVNLSLELRNSLETTPPILNFGNNSGRLPVVVVGNPPYSGHSNNKTKWSHQLLRGNLPEDPFKRDYFSVGGKPLGERNPKWLNDDFVKFIRLAQLLVDVAGVGLVGYVVNNSFLSNVTFRGMREQLLQSFNIIYILDLHGNIKKGSDGVIDENIFGGVASVGVAIIFLGKTNSKIPSKENNPLTIKHAGIQGTLAQKLDFLRTSDLHEISWAELNPYPPYYFLSPLNSHFFEEYNRGQNLADLFTHHSLGIVTARDRLTIQPTPEAVLHVVTDFLSLPDENLREKYKLGKDVQDWSLEGVRKDLQQEDQCSTHKIRSILYRPLDVRYTYYTGRSRGFMCRPRHDIMRHLERTNFALLTCRQLNKEGFSHVWVTDTLVDNCLLSTQTKERTYVFPLLTYNGVGDSQPNTRAEVIRNFSSAEELFYYCYALLHSNSYRQRFAPFLVFDFPKVPITPNKVLLRCLSNIGQRLVVIHLNHKESVSERSSNVELIGEGSNLIQSVSPKKYRQGCLWINNNQYLAPLEEEVMKFAVGRHLVIVKWLKNRNKQLMANKNLAEFQKVVAMVEETIELSQKVDASIEQYGGWPLI